MERTPKLLLVDDQEANLLLLNEFVEVLGLASIHARNGMQALSQVAAHEPDLVLLDIMMPGMDGVQVLEMLMKDPVHKHIPVIMVSAVDDMERVAWCISQGAADYLVKPFNLTLLKARIHSCLEKKRFFDRDQQNRKRLEEAHLKISEQNDRLVINNERLKDEIEKRYSVERDLRLAQRVALRNAHASGMADLAASVLHNIGNTLNSVNTSCHQLHELVHGSCFGKLVLANKLFHELLEKNQIAERGTTLLDYYEGLQEGLTHENGRMQTEIQGLLDRVDTIKNIIQAQRNLTTGKAFKESLDLNDVVETVLRLQRESLSSSGIEVVRRVDQKTLIIGQKSKLSHIILNLIANARESMDPMNGHKKLTIHIGVTGDEAFLKIIDNGEGIPSESLKKIFHHGYTTRKGSHGFGLHATAIAVTELEGRIEAMSDGPGTGATFALFFKRLEPRETSGIDKALSME